MIRFDAATKRPSLLDIYRLYSPIVMFYHEQQQDFELHHGELLCKAAVRAAPSPKREPGSLSFDHAPVLIGA